MKTKTKKQTNNKKNPTWVKYRMLIKRDTVALLSTKATWKKQERAICEGLMPAR